MSDRTCIKCSKVFLFPSRLEIHLTSSTTCNPLYEGRIFPCLVCHKRFAHKRTLARHIKDSNCIIEEKQIEPITEPITENINILALKEDPTTTEETKRILEKLEQLEKEYDKIAIEKQELIAKLKLSALQQPMTQVNNIVYNTDNSTHNTINQVNQINHYHNTTIINPVGCEDLSKITVEQLNSIYANIEHSTGKLLNCIYSNVENQNFCKDNVNKRDMKYYSKDNSIEYTLDYKFIDVIKESLLRFHLSLIYNHKHKLPLETFKDYLYKITIIEGLLKELEADTLDNSDEEYYEISHNKHVKTTMNILINKHSRDKSVNNNIKSLVSSLKDNEEIKAVVEKRIKLHTEGFTTAFSEYKTKSSKPQSYLLDDRNLNLYKTKCIESKKTDQQFLYNKNIIL